MGEPVEVLSALCNGLIRPKPLPSRFVGLFVQLSNCLLFKTAINGAAHYNRAYNHYVATSWQCKVDS